MTSSRVPGRPAARATDLGKLQQNGDGGDDALNLPIRSRGIVTGDVGASRGQVAQGRLRPDYSHFGMGSSSGRPHD